MNSMKKEIKFTQIKELQVYFLLFIMIRLK